MNSDGGQVSEKDSNPKDIIGTRKAPMSTVPAGVIAERGVAMLEGACKYGRHNYRAVGIRASVYYDATMRHLMAWWEGEDVDPDSGLSHITKAIASLAVLRDAQMRSMVQDDRAPATEPFYPDLNECAATIINRYADRHPRHYDITWSSLQRACLADPIELQTFGPLSHDEGKTV